MTKQETRWLQTVRRVIAELAASDVAEFELSQDDFRLLLRRTPSSRRGRPLSEAEPASAEGVQILAPFTGIFYRAASPTAEPYVREGDWVENGTTVGLIETMKIFNEVQSEQAGRIERILRQNGELVQASDPLILLVPGERPPQTEARL